MTWYDDNQLRAYPLVGHDDYRIPHNILVDCVVQAPDTITGIAQVISISVTPMVVSVLIGIGGVVVASLTIGQDSAQPGIPYDLVPALQGVSGFVAFGDGIKTSSLRVDGPVDLVPQALVSYTADPLNATLVALGQPFQGLVQLTVSPDLSLTARSLRLFNGTGVQVVNAYVLSAVSTGALEDPVSACWRRADGVLGRTPLRSVAGVPPDTAGALTLQVFEVRQTTDAPAVTASARADGMTLVDNGLMCQGEA